MLNNCPGEHVSEFYRALSSFTDQKSTIIYTCAWIHSICEDIFHSENGWQKRYYTDPVTQSEYGLCAASRMAREVTGFGDIVANGLFSKLSHS